MATYKEGKFTRTTTRSTVRFATSFDEETLQGNGITTTVYGVESNQMSDYGKKKYSSVFAKETARETVKIIIKDSDLYAAIINGTLPAEIVPANTADTEKGESNNE